jgi:7,8-dihydropterin-6-yl-methyl-4-(beta-D-ribofuranosyl)aminobenzene 5'-phosphate synthase
MYLSIISENTSILSEAFQARFGLGLVFTSEDSKILIDCGPDNSFINNAKLLDIDIADIDICIITHAHHDHGGGLRSFLELNKKAKVYLSPYCDGDYYSNNLQTSEYKSISFDRNLFSEYSDRISFVKNDVAISPQIAINTIDINPDNFFPKMNGTLYKKSGADYVHDDFKHELAILIKDNGNNHLVTGCAHSGITNMIESSMKKNNIKQITSLIGGFHLVNPGTRKLGEPEENVVDLAHKLNSYKIEKVITGHCTGTDGFAILKDNYNGKILNMTTGFKIAI